MRNTILFLVAVFAVAALFVSCSAPSPDIPDMEFVEGGVGLFGSDTTEADADERPMREVEIGSFYIAKFEVTQSQWEYVMKYNPSLFLDQNRPVESVSWYDVQEYIKKLNELTGKNYRLPTELEWEYAARGGKYQNAYRYSGSDDADDVAWWRANAINGTSEVGLKSANKLGLYDMTGNVHEWCSNEYDSLLYSREVVRPNVVLQPIDKVTVKGGGWSSDTIHLRIANRNHIQPKVQHYTIGFRVAMDAE